MNVSLSRKATVMVSSWMKTLCSRRSSEKTQTVTFSRHLMTRFFLSVCFIFQYLSRQRPAVSAEMLHYTYAHTHTHTTNINLLSSTNKHWSLCLSFASSIVMICIPSLPQPIHTAAALNRATHTRLPAVSRSTAITPRVEGGKNIFSRQAPCLHRPGLLVRKFTAELQVVINREKIHRGLTDVSNQFIVVFYCAVLCMLTSDKLDIE